ncbi:exodeoxyribonuclease III [Deinococcus psychrotolerans]|uniref:Exodeoxyribonuclease III n=2 Tax=Deinococcus TaxID=1298 RepID=A0A553UMC7_9DEIO|nr:MULTISPECIES: exodeoxyribonuclease III [Deinococcus]AZI43387.1 exodeoxyribonuclease III [Deinococcus psychrotolerans]TSA81373.1 exodeoxyribonuclease III [Deinococcus detaillensis]
MSSLTSLNVTTLNVNGLRSALSKGLLGWLERHAPDVLLLQEVRAEPLPEVFAALGYDSCWHPAQKAGYSGVALLSRRGLSDVQMGMNDPEVDAEGRVLSAVVEGVRFASVYLPSGASRPERQLFKERVLVDFAEWTRGHLSVPDAESSQDDNETKTAAPRPPLIIGGDFNVAHTELDIKNWQSNRNKPGFLPHEREWMSQYLALGLRDSHRDHLIDRREYTWWSNRANAFNNDVGWRIDYLLAAGLPLTEVWVERRERFSDHAPLSGRLIGVTP